MTGAPSGSLAEAVEQAAALLATDPARAEISAGRILKAIPSDPRALLIVGSARRRRGDVSGARTVLEPLARAFPRAAHTQYELGLVFAALGETPQAVAALGRAVAVNRDLSEAWRALGELLFKQGDAAGAQAAFAEQVRASVQDPALRPAAEALFAGRPEQAEPLLRRRLEVSPTDTVALRMLAEAIAALGRHRDAELLFVRCLELDPDYDGARFCFADLLHRQQKASDAIPHVDALLARDSAEPAYRNLMAACLGLVGAYDRALALYEGLLAEFPTQPKIWLNYGHALRTVGRREEAVVAYRRCLALAPELGDAYWSLANLKVAPISPAEEAAMLAQLERPGLDAEDRLHLHYALGKALENRGEHANAFDHYARGAAIRRGQVAYDASAMTAFVSRSKALFDPAFFAERAGAGSRSDEPIFIVGLPRSGSTLIEQILASHSAVEGVGELAEVGFIAGELGAGYPEILADLDAAELAAMGEHYLERIRTHRRQGRVRFIDKMPNNFLHVGLIQLILPRAIIVDARRHPMGSCFSAFKQHFAQGQAFSYDLTDLGRYYRDYVDLMAHVDAVLPGRVHRVVYEDLVQDTEVEIRRLLDHCGLPFEPACLTFYENTRAVRTVSSEQVRRPIYREGVDQWRRYQSWLGPLEEALGPTLDSWR